MMKKYLFYTIKELFQTQKCVVKNKILSFSTKNIK